MPGDGTLIEEVISGSHKLEMGSLKGDYGSKYSLTVRAPPDMTVERGIALWLSCCLS